MIYTMLVLIVVYISGLVLMINVGHANAVAKSESNLRSKYDSGQLSAESRVLMRNAGYNV
ncbi:hypothetical protein GW796_08145 [archaeon]|nr:hypothetical protein [archaeon]